MSVCVCVCVVLRSLIQSATCRDYRLQMYTQCSSHQQQPSTTLPVHAADTPASTGGSGGGLSSADGGKRRASVGGDRLSSAETVGGSDGDSGISSAKRPRCHDDEQSAAAAAAALQSVQHTHTHSHTHTHTQPFNGPLSRTIQVCRYQSSTNPTWILLKQETVSGGGISWAIICKSASRSRQITTPAPHHPLHWNNNNDRLTAFDPGQPG